MSPILVSVSDPAGRIAGVNSAFVEATGYDRHELLGQPHSILRHPDMPAAAFIDLWTTLGEGLVWRGVMKNRCKDGSHFWALTYAAPLTRAGLVDGYVAVRTLPSAQQILDAEGLYRALAAGQSAWPSVRSARRRLGVARIAIATVAGSSAVSLGALVSPHGTGLGLLWAAILASMGLTAWLEFELIRPLQAVQRQALAVATGSVSNIEEPDSVYEVGMCLRALHLTALHRRSVSDEVQHAKEELLRADGALPASSDRLSQAIEHSAAALQQVTAVQVHAAALLHQRAASQRALVASALESLAVPGAASPELRGALSTLVRWAQGVGEETAAAAAQAGDIERALAGLDRCLQDQAAMANELRLGVESAMSRLASLAIAADGFSASPRPE